jgi:radical SAM-linked protein
MRMLVVFKKDARLRHIGHLDLLRTMQRALRRSGLPIAYSLGFNPHILNTFASALSVGASGQREIMDVKLYEQVDCEKFKAQLSDALPPDIVIKEVISIEDTHPAPMSLLCAAEYEAVFQGDNCSALSNAIEAVMAQSEIPSMRKTKKGMKACDIKPMIYALKAEGNKIAMLLSLTEQATCKPVMVLEALKEKAGLEMIPRYDLSRLGLYGKNDKGELVPLETL